MKPTTALRIILFSLLVILQSSVTYGTNPGEKQLDFALGLFQRGDYAEALPEFETYLNHAEWKAGRPVCLFFYAETLQRLGKEDEAEKAYLRLLEAYPKVEYAPVARFRLAKIFLVRKDGESALRYLTPLADRKLPPELAKGVYYSLGTANSLIGNSTKAIEWWKRVWEEFPESGAGRRAILGIGNEYAHLGQCEKAVQFLKNWLDIPTSRESNAYPEALSQLAECEEDLGNTREALKHYLSLSRIDSATEVRERSIVASARLALREKDYSVFDQIASGLPTHFEKKVHLYSWYLIAGSRYFTEQEWEKAAGNFERALHLYTGSEELRNNKELKPDFPRLRLAWCYFALGNWTELVEILEKCDTKMVQSDEYRYLMAEALARQDRWEEAYEWFNQVSPDSSYSKEALLGQADAAFHLERWEEASRIYLSLFKRATHSGEEPLFLLLRAAEAEKNLERWSEAALLSASAVIRTSSPLLRERLLYQQGWCLLKAENYREAAAVYGKLIENYPHSRRFPDFLWMRAESCRGIEDTTCEVKALKRLTEQFPDSPWYPNALIRLAASYTRLENREGVLNTLLTYQERFPEKPLSEEYTLWLASELLTRNQPGKALVVLNPLLDRETSDKAREEGLFLVGRAEELLGNYRKALESYREAVSAYPEGRHLLSCRLGAARVARKLDDRLEAWDQVHRAVDFLTTHSSVDPEVEAQIYLLAGDLAFEEEDFETAYRFYARPTILFRHPKWTAEALYKSALAKEKMGKTEDAARLREELRREFPDFVPEEGT